MPSPINRQWVLTARPDGPIGDHNFRWTQGAIPSISEGQMLLRNLWLSFDPTQWFLMAYYSEVDSESNGIPIGGVMRGLTVSQVVESRLEGFHPGDLVHGYSGWEEYSASDGRGYFPTTRVPPGVPPNLALGTLGVTGMAAYFGVVDVARPKAGETFVVSAAAGGVGSIAGQMAKILGLKVIGIAGGRQKCDWLVGEAGFDGAIDHRSEDVGARLTALCPDGIDIYFDNVGGPTLDLARERLRRNGRIVVCGGTSRYAETVQPPGPVNYLALCMVNGRMEGLLARDYADRFPEAVAALSGWLASGRLRSKEDVVVGLEHAPSTLARLYSGANFGKQLLKIADPVDLPAA
ncbi:MAG: NADP-dependent oxidoreductase [Thermoplasmata archaeon]|nr:NADP-dependent oxidoreductase [Thermoplasmata archaeon]